MNKLKNIVSNLPSIAWVILLPLGIFALIGGIIFLFFIISSVEGAASVIILIAGIFVIRGSDSINVKGVKEKSSGFMVGVGIVFFALMGMAIDQPGNFIYNKPIEVLFCPAGTYLSRDQIVSHPLPERTDITQDFDCVDSTGNAATSIDMWNVILVRFVEYVIIGYILIGLNKLFSKKIKDDNLFVTK
ncbi:MAG: hypothetical protein ABI721_01275 [Candidatus Dojkabacteria bacterium]